MNCGRKLLFKSKPIFRSSCTITCYKPHAVDLVFVPVLSYFLYGIYCCRQESKENEKYFKEHGYPDPRDVLGEKEYNRIVASVENKRNE